MPSPPTPERTRLTISVTPEVQETFQRMATAASMSLGRAIGDWLEDTLDAAQYTASLMEKARAAPKTVSRELHAYALGLADETAELMAKVRKGRADGPGPDARSAPSPVRPPDRLSPRPVIRGGKSPEQGQTRKARKA